MKFHAQPAVTKNYILKRVTQEEIFEHYLSVEVQTHKEFCNPLRADKSPTCNFGYLGRKLYFRDWSWTEPLDCFDVVMRIYNCNFYEALHHIEEDLRLGKKPERTFSINQSARETSQSRTKIQVRTAPPSDEDRTYFQQYTIDPRTLQHYNCHPIDAVWLGGRRIWIRTDDDPAVGYYFGTDENGVQKWKIYFYHRSNWRFMCNTAEIQGWSQLPDHGDVCVITKSLKDVMCLSTFGLTAIAPQSESTPIDDDRIGELQKRFSQLVSLYDFDYAGIRMAALLKRKHSIPPLFLTDGRFGTFDYGQKDFSDYVAAYGRASAYDLIERAEHAIFSRTHELAITQ